MNGLYDVAIIGGGPAGSTAATFLAKKGRDVIVLEKEKFPRFHIGESLLPYTMGAFDRLGVREKLDARFLKKFGAEISTACGTNTVKFHFKDGFRLRHDRSYQVTRSEFDKVLLDHAAEHGAKVMEETAVQNVKFGADETEITIGSGSEERKIRARYLIDCSGRNTVVGNYFNLKKMYSNLKKFSVYAHYENVGRDEGVEGTFIRLIRGVDRWFWMIPLTATKMSIGVVMDTADFKALKKKPEEALDAALREQPTIWSRMEGAAKVTEVYSASDYSYRNSRLTGERWLLAGDAAGFIDPIFSTGVFMAIQSGEDAADAIDAVLTHPETRPAAFKRYERSLNRVMDVYLRFVSNWYRPRFIEVMTNPVNIFQVVPVVNAVLAGNLSARFSIWWRMQFFYLICFVQRYVPLCPRLSLVPGSGEAGQTEPCAPRAAKEIRDAGGNR